MITVKRFLNLPPVKLQAAVDKMSGAQRGELCKELEALASAAAAYAGYVDMRYGNGCGDQGHDDAVTEFNRVRKGVRKTMGYDTTPQLSF